MGVILLEFIGFNVNDCLQVDISFHMSSTLDNRQTEDQALNIFSQLTNSGPQVA